jgi:hypothetical protein
MAQHDLLLLDIVVFVLEAFHSMNSVLIGVHTSAGFEANPKINQHAYSQIYSRSVTSTHYLCSTS